MSKQDTHVIRSSEALRKVVGPHIPGLELKNRGPVRGPQGREKPRPMPGGMTAGYAGDEMRESCTRAVYALCRVRS